MEYQFGWFPRPKYRDLVFYVKADQGMNVSLFDLPDTEENRAIIGALIGPADELAALLARAEKAEAALRKIDAGFCYHRLTIKQAQAIIREALAGKGE